MPRSRDNFERSTQWNKNRHHHKTCAAALIGLSMMAVGHGADINNARPLPVSATPAHTTPQLGPLSRVATGRPLITFVDQPTPKAREFIVWAIDRFLDAGLQLPDLRISFPNVCGGKAALYHVGRALHRLLLCQQAHRASRVRTRLGRHIGKSEPPSLPRVAWADHLVGRNRNGIKRARLGTTRPDHRLGSDGRRHARCPPTTRELRERTHKGLHHAHRRVQAPANSARSNSPIVKRCGSTMAPQKQAMPTGHPTAGTSSSRRTRHVWGTGSP
jgi:hypothetical protein